MADRTLTIKVGANVSGYVAAMKTMAQATKDGASQASGWTAKHRDGINEISTGLLKGGLVLTGFAALAAKKFADFDAAMSGVGAATMETTENMGLLREAALQAGADTQYSATQAADGITALAKAGVQTTDILKGGLTGALNLAASAQMDVGTAAEITATALNQYQLKGKDASHVSDLLAASAGKAMGDVTDMAGALKYVGPVAHQMGISIEETAGTIAFLAQQGVLGEQAGTSLRGMLSSLTSPSKVAAQEMKNLGINVYDVATGAFVGFNGVAEQLKTKMHDLTAAERDEAFGRIFGNEQITTARLLYDGGAKAIDTWTESVNDSGYAAEQARIKTDNLKGDIERLGGSIDTALIQSGSGANDALRNIAQGAEAAVNQIGGLPAPLLNATTLLAGAGGLAVLGVSGMLKLATSVNDAKVAIDGLNINMGKAKLAAGVLGGVLAIGTTAFMLWANAQAEAKARTDEFASTLDEFGNTTDSTIRKINGALSQERGGLFGLGQQRSLIDFAEKYGVATKDLTGYILGEEAARKRVTAATDAYVQTQVKSGQSDQAREEINSHFINILDQQSNSLTDAEKQQAQNAEANRDAGLAAEDAAAATDENTTAIERYAAAQQTGTAQTQDYTDALKELVDAQREASGVVLSQRDAQRQLEDSYQGVTDALREQVDDLARQYEAQGEGADAAKARAEAEVAVANKLDITTEAGRRNQEALDNVASSGWDLIDSMRANGATQGDLQSTMQTTRDRFIGVAEQMGLSAEQASALADELNLIPENISVAVAADTATATRQVEAWRTSMMNQALVIQARVNADPNYSPARAGSYIMRAGGGSVNGPGTSTSDSIRAYLSNGEYVIRAKTVAQRPRAYWDDLNAGHFATGGMVGLTPTFATPTPRVATMATPGPLPPIYVQNPFTGEYLLAKVDGRVNAGIGAQQQTFSRSRGSA